MASITVTVPQGFPVGTTLSVYVDRVGDVIPQGPPVSTATIASDSTVVLTGLTPGVTYIAGAQIGPLWRGFVVEIPVVVTPPTPILSYTRGTVPPASLHNGEVIMVTDAPGLTDYDRLRRSDGLVWRVQRNGVADYFGADPPTTIGAAANLVARYRTDTESYTEGQNAGTIHDRAGAAGDLTSFGTNPAPIFHPVGGPGDASYVSQSLQSAYQSAQKTPAYITGTGASIYMVCRLRDFASYSRLVQLRAAGAVIVNTQANANSSPISAVRGGQVVTQPLNALEWQLVVIRFDGTNMYFRIGSNAEASVAVGGTFAIDQIVFGQDISGTWADLDWTEMLLYKQFVSGQDDTDLRNYFHGSYGVPV